MSGDTIASVTITDGGEGYLSASPPAVTFSGGGGTGAAGTAVVNSSGLVTGVTITNAGSGYTSVPTLTFAPSPSNTTAEVKSWDSATRTLEIINRTGTFNTNETVTGNTSGAVHTPETYNTLNNTSSEYDQNYSFETVDDEILDFTESNPFGTVGRTTDLTI